MDPVEQPKVVFPGQLPLGDARLVRPAEVRRLRFDDFLRIPNAGRPRVVRVGESWPVIPIEAVAAGDTQVLAAHEPGKIDSPHLDLDPLADFPSVESVVACTRIRASRDLPSIREILVLGHSLLVDTATLSHLPGLESLYIPHVARQRVIDLACLPAQQMRQLAIWRWDVASLAPLAHMTGLRHLDVTFFKESVDILAALHELTYLNILGPAKGWASLRQCANLEIASIIDFQMANMKRWDTWKRLRIACFGGRGVKSLAGIEACEQLESLLLLNLRTGDLAPLRDLQRLSTLTLRLPDRAIDLASIAQIPKLRRFEIDAMPVTQNDVAHLPSLAPLWKAAALEEIILNGTCVDDGDLSPLASIGTLRRVHLGQDINCDVEKLRQARPDVTIDYKPPSGPARKFERVGQVNIYPPGDGINEGSIFDSFAQLLHTSTNYAAEKLIRTEVRKSDPALLKRLDWDTEAGAVGIYAKDEKDIRAVADAINRLLSR